jgi:hypothetical protein
MPSRMKNLLLTACGLYVVVLTGCTETRSISRYNYSNNPSYTGELSQIGFIKDVSGAGSEQHPAGTPLTAASKILVIQSGMAYPDAELIRAFPDPANLSGISGNPEIGTVDRIPLRLAAQQGGMDYVLGIWGIIRTEDSLISIHLSCILADVHQGTWKHLDIQTAPIKKANAFIDPNGADDQQIRSMKEQAYRELASRLFAKSADANRSVPAATPQ